MLSEKKLNAFSGNQNKIFICRRCLSSYTSEKKTKCEKFEINTIRTSSDSHLLWKDHFYKKPFYHKIDADFEADNEIDNSNIGNKTTSFYKQNPVCTA